MDVETAWVEAVAALGGDRAVAAVSASELAARYREPHRRYHGTSHVEAVLGDAAQLAADAALTGRDQALLALAVCAHDVVYDAKPGEDEAASAAWAERHVATAGVDAASTARVVELVMTTLTHTASADDVLATLLSDADLAVLGADEQEYDAYVAGVRAEYGAVPESSGSSAAGTCWSSCSRRTGSSRRPRRTSGGSDERGPTCSGSS